MQATLSLLPFVDEPTLVACPISTLFSANGSVWVFTLLTMLTG